MAVAESSKNVLKPARSRRWLWRVLLVVAGMTALVWFAPVLVARTPLLELALRHGLADMQGSADVSSATLGWFSKVELRGVTVRDAQGQAVAEMGVVRSERNLLALVSDLTDLGNWQIEQATVNLTWQAKSSNVETVFDKYLYGTSAPTEFGTAYHVRVSAGTLFVTDADSGQKWTVNPVDITVAAARERKQPLSIRANGPVTEPTNHGVLKLELDISRTTPTTPFGVATKVEMERGPLAAVSPLLRRFQPGVAVAGNANGTVVVKYVEDKQESVQVAGRVDATGFTLDAPQWLAEPLHLQSISIPAQIALAGQRLAIQALHIQTDIGSASAEGSFDLGGKPTELLRHAGTKIDINVDLARLAKAVPKTIKLRTDMQLTTGQLRANLTSTAGASGVKWDGRMITSDLQGVHAGQAVTWKQPLTVTLSATTQANGLPRIDLLKCTADFLQADVVEHGDNQFVVKATCQLSKLRQQLAQFVDVEDWMPEGSASATCTATRSGDQTYKIEGEAKLQQFQLRTSSKRIWQEPEVVLKWGARLQPRKDGDYEADAGAVTLQAGPVWVWAALQEPAPLTTSGLAVHAKIRVYGELAKWRAIAAAWTPAATEWPISGMGEISGRVRYSASNLEFHDLKAEYQNFRLAKFGLNIVEPKVTLLASGRRDAKSGRIQLLDASLTCPTATIIVPVASLGFDAHGNIEAVGKGTMRGDVARLERWFRAENEKSSLVGTWSGNVQFQPIAGATGFSVDATAKVTPTPSQTGAAGPEAILTLAMAGAYNGANGSLQLDNAQIDGAGLVLQVKGGISSMTERPSLKLTGLLEYDWEKFDPQFRALLTNKVRLTGRGSRPLRLEGTLATPIALNGTLGVGWDSIQLFGCQVGPAKLDLQFSGNSIQIQPIQTTLNQGRVYLTPAVRLEPAPAELTWGKGSGVDRAKISQALCDEWLGYAAPALARATDADGEVSVRLGGGRVPFGAPEKADLSAQVVLHSVRVSATSPMLRLLSTVLQTPPTVALQKEAVVNVRVVNGRVYHDRFELAFPGLTIRTSGSVGFDGTLELLVESPLPPRWVPNVPWKDVLAKQTIKIPLRGTLAKPQLDEDALRRHLADVTRDAARGAANDTLRKEIERGFDRLFPPKK